MTDETEEGLQPDRFDRGEPQFRPEARLAAQYEFAVGEDGTVFGLRFVEPDGTSHLFVMDSASLPGFISYAQDALAAVMRRTGPKN